MQENRLQRINSEIKKALAEILANEIRDPRLNGLISITDVDTTNDLSHCYILVSIYEKDKKLRQQSFYALQHSAGLIKLIYVLCHCSILNLMTALRLTKKWTS